MKHVNASFWATLKESGCVTGDLPEQQKLESPWYVKTLMAFSGWLAAAFMLCFIGAAFEVVFENTTLAAMIGMILIGGAFFLLRLNANEFTDHLALAVSLAGQGLMVFALYDITGHDKAMLWLSLALLQGVLAIMMPNFIHGAISSMVSAISLSIALVILGMPHVMGGVLLLGASLCWFHEWRYPRYMKKIRALGYGLIFALIALESTLLLGHRTTFGGLYHKYPGFWSYPWLKEGLLGAVTLFVVLRLLQRYKQPINGRLFIITLLAMFLLCFVSIHVQGLIVGVVILCLGFFGSNHSLLGLGMVSLLFYISSYYYLLDRTLMEKSLSLLAVGLFLLCGRWLMNRILPIEKEVAHG